MTDQEIKQAICALPTDQLNDFQIGFQDNCRKWLALNFRSDKQRNTALKLLDEVRAKLDGEPEQEYARESAETAAQKLLRERQGGFEQTARQQALPAQRAPQAAPSVAYPPAIDEKLQCVVKAATDQIRESLPPELRGDVDWLIRRALIYFATKADPAIKRCSDRSKLDCILHSASCGLPLDGDKSYAIAYDGVAKWQPSYKGLIELAKRDPEIADIRAFVVKQEDEYAREIVDGKERRVHRFAPLNQRGETIGAYATVYLKDGSTHTEEMDLDDLQAVMRCSKMCDEEGNPLTHDRYGKPLKGVNMWRDFPDQARKKSAVRRLCNTYVSTRNHLYAQAVAYDNEHYKINEPEQKLIPEGGGVFDQAVKQRNIAFEIKAEIEAAERDPDPNRVLHAVRDHIDSAHAAGDLSDADRDHLMELAIGGVAGSVA